MGAGLATSAQIEAFRRIFPPGMTSRSLWLSATLNSKWLRTIDLAPHLSDFASLELSDLDCDQAGERLNAVKSLQQAPVVLKAEARNDVLPALVFDGESSEEVTLRLALMELGKGEQGRSWIARVLDLLDGHGPFRLTWVETLVRIVGWRASTQEQLAHRRDLGKNLHHGLETEHQALATTGSRAATPDSPAQHSPEGRPQHGLRGRTGGSADAGKRNATPDHATRQLETSLDDISYAKLAPHSVARRSRFISVPGRKVRT